MSDDQGPWVPTFPRQRPPFQPGNDVSVQHGAFSPRKVDPLAADLVERMVSDASLGYLQAPAFRPALWAWARAEAQVQLLSEFLERRAAAVEDPLNAGVGDLADERVKTAYLLLHRAEARALSGRRALGLDPLARARLGKDVAQGRQADAAAVLTQWRAQIEAGDREVLVDDEEEDDDA